MAKQNFLNVFFNHLLVKATFLGNDDCLEFEAFIIEAGITGGRELEAGREGYIWEKKFSFGFWKRCHSNFP